MGVGKMTNALTDFPEDDLSTETLRYDLNEARKEIVQLRRLLGDKK